MDNQKVAGSNPSGHAMRESLKSLRFQGFAFFAYPSRITFAVAMGALPWYNDSEAGSKRKDPDGGRRI